jgi:deazaflavin-dependent oxidoreductase (nitroreductase family)
LFHIKDKINVKGNGQECPFHTCKSKIKGQTAGRSKAVATAKDGLKERLGRDREITISVIGRKSGRKISNPVWFALDGEKLYLLPVYGSKTQWYQNVRKNPVIGIAARGAGGEFRATTVTGAKAVAVVERFREKYGAGDVKKYYSGLDVAVVVGLE